MRRWVGSRSSEIPLDSEKQVSASDQQCSSDRIPASFYPESFQDTNQIYAPSHLQDHSRFSSLSWSEEVDARSSFHIDDLIPDKLKQEPVNLCMDSTLLSRNFSPLPTTAAFYPVCFEEDALTSNATSTSFANNVPSVQRLYNDCSPSQDITYNQQGFGSRNGHEGDPLENATVKDLMVESKTSNLQTCSKRPRSSSSVPFTAFKVRKEKLGDRISVLQQLVSPFGKTDTASVLQDTIDYIKFLHDQVVVLSNPYMKLSHDRETSGQTLKARGLCLVPVSTTLNVAKDNPSEFWAPTFGGSYR